MYWIFGNLSILHFRYLDLQINFSWVFELSNEIYLKCQIREFSLNMIFNSSYINLLNFSRAKTLDKVDKKYILVIQSSGNTLYSRRTRMWRSQTRRREPSSCRGHIRACRVYNLVHPSFSMQFKRFSVRANWSGISLATPSSPPVISSRKTWSFAAQQSVLLDSWINSFKSHASFQFRISAVDYISPREF